MRLEHLYFLSSGGPCQSRDDIKKLLSNCRSVSCKQKALTLQLNYHRLVLGSKSTLLTKGEKTIEEVVENLVAHLQNMQPDSLNSTIQLPQLSLKRSTQISSLRIKKRMRRDQENRLSCLRGRGTLWHFVQALKAIMTQGSEQARSCKSKMMERKLAYLYTTK